jgi:signal peptidase II
MIEAVIMAVTVVLLDQASKRLVTARLAEGQTAIGAFGVCVRHFVNRRRRTIVTVFGAVLPLAVTLVVTVALAMSVAALQTRAAQLGVGAALGGATGNTLDRLLRDGVIDFVDLRVWPVFNVADVAIVAGVASILWSLI